MQYRIKGHFCSWGEQRRLQERFDTENGGQSIKVCLTIAPAGASTTAIAAGDAQDSTARFCGTAVQAGAGRRFREMFRRRNWRSSLPTQDELCNALARDGRVDPFPVASLPRQRSAHMYMFMCMSLVVNTREVPWLPLVVNTVEVP